MNIHCGPGQGQSVSLLLGVSRQVQHRPCTALPTQTTNRGSEVVPLNHSINNTCRALWLDPRTPDSATGLLHVLCADICESLSAHSLAMTWHPINIFGTNYHIGLAAWLGGLFTCPSGDCSQLALRQAPRTCWTSPKLFAKVLAGAGRPAVGRIMQPADPVHGLSTLGHQVLRTQHILVIVPDSANNLRMHGCQRVADARLLPGADGAARVAACPAVDNRLPLMVVPALALLAEPPGSLVGPAGDLLRCQILVVGGMPLSSQDWRALCQGLLPCRAHHMMSSESIRLDRSASWVCKLK